jgi:hypothetical protein
VLVPALVGLSPVEAPWLRALLELELARAHEAIGDRAAAIVEARAARALLSSLDVVLAPEDARLLERLTTSAAPPGAVPPKPTARLERGDRFWTVSSDNASVRLSDGKGLRYLAELVAHPDVEQHALDLVDRIEGIDDEGGLNRRALGDAGPRLDAQARAAYRKRIETLREAAAEAEERGAFEAAETAQAEVDELVRQLAQAFGLGGKQRPTGSAAEKARLNVTRALRSAITRIQEALPEAGSALDRQVRTGLYCAYEPRGDAISWVVQS